MITETCHFLSTDGKRALLTWIQRGGLALQPVGVDDFDEIAPVLERYSDREMDFADATLVWLADLINTLDVMTVDRRDFLVYRSQTGKPFNLVLS